jgi:hypothetical protein
MSLRGTRALIFACGLALSALSVRAALVARYDFEEGAGMIATDPAGSRNGLLVNGPVFIPGHFGNYAQHSDGVDDFVNLGDNSTLLQRPGWRGPTTRCRTWPPAPWIWERRGTARAGISSAVIWMTCASMTRR